MTKKLQKGKFQIAQKPDLGFQGIAATYMHTFKLLTLVRTTCKIRTITYNKTFSIQF